MTPVVWGPPSWLLGLIICLWGLLNCLWGHPSCFFFWDPPSLVTIIISYGAAASLLQNLWGNAPFSFSSSPLPRKPTSWLWDSPSCLWFWGLQAASELWSPLSTASSRQIAWDSTSNLHEIQLQWNSSSGRREPPFVFAIYVTAVPFATMIAYVYRCQLAKRLIYGQDVTCYIISFSFTQKPSLRTKDMPREENPLHSEIIISIVGNRSYWPCGFYKNKKEISIERPGIFPLKYHDSWLWHFAGFLAHSILYENKAPAGQWCVLEGCKRFEEEEASRTLLWPPITISDRFIFERVLNGLFLKKLMQNFYFQFWSWWS